MMWQSSGLSRIRESVFMLKNLQLKGSPEAAAPPPRLREQHCGKEKPLVNKASVHIDIWCSGALQQ